MFVRCFASTIHGIDAMTVTVEANISQGIGMYLVGLPDSAVKESQERIRSAFQNSGYRMTGKRLVVNLAPADLRKEGSGFDLPIAMAILAATGQCPEENIGRYIIIGELSLDGTVLPVKGALPVAINAKEKGFKGVILPEANAEEAAVVGGLEVIGVAKLRDAVEFLSGDREISPATWESGTDPVISARMYPEDFSDVKGQQHVKRALEIAAAGGHNVIMIGSPGSGKTMLARRMPSIMPPLSLDEALETTKIHSVAGKLGSTRGLITTRPFRSPHHLASQVALVGGGANPQPGEISLAHNGILFMDELPEFGRAALEVLRQPLEDKKVTVSRAKYSVEYPSNFILIASMNPCPCGFYNHPSKDKCNCPPGAVGRYLNRISGPLLDRIDMHIEVIPVPFAEMSAAAPAEPSALIRERVVRAREIQQRRFEGIKGVHTNAMMSSSMLKDFAALDKECSLTLEKAMNMLDLSARAYDRIIKVARTIADLSNSPEITRDHIGEAIYHRCLDREGWGNSRS